MTPQIPHAIILGSGTSTGVPLIAKEYPASFLANPKNHRLRPALLIKGPEGNILVDAGPDIRQQLLRHQVKRIHSVLITHTHADHIMGMDDLRAFSTSRENPVTIYTSPEHQADIRRIFGYAFGEFPPEIFVPRFDLRDAPCSIHLAGLDLTIFWVMHGPTKVMGIRIHDFAYLTDVNFIPHEVRPLLEGLDILVLDAVRYRPHPNHFHFDAAMAAAQEIGAKTTYFTHLSDDYDHDVVERELPAKIRLAYDGLTLPIIRQG